MKHNLDLLIAEAREEVSVYAMFACQVIGIVVVLSVAAAAMVAAFI